MSHETCERCQSELKPTTYEGHPVVHCPGCEAYWLGPKALKGVLKSTEVDFTRSQRDAALETKAEEGDDPLVFCLTCHAPADRLNVLGLLMIDYCAGHGIWLDAGELERIQVLAETNEQWRKTMVKVVSGKREAELEG